MKPVILAPIIVHDPPEEATDDEIPFDRLWETALADDTFEAEILSLLKRGVRHSKKIPLVECSKRDGHLYFRDRRYVPDSEELQNKLLLLNHDVPAAGHPDKGKTYELISKNYYWPNMSRKIKRYVRNCHDCVRAKAQLHAYQG